MNDGLVVSIGTTHPWNIAGVGLDARVVGEYGLSHATAVAAVSAQDARGLHDLHVIPAHALRAQLESLPPGATAFRIGSLGSSRNVRVAARYLRERSSRAAIVVDPVMTVTLGGELWGDDRVVETIDEVLLPLPVVVTPNLNEAAQLAGMPVHTLGDMRVAAARIRSRGARAVYVKGGHLDGDPVDLLLSDGGEVVFRESRLEGSMRGGGCALAAALACELALGKDLRSAARRARAYVRAKIAQGNMRNGLQVAF